MEIECFKNGCNPFLKHSIAKTGENPRKILPSNR
jgi:predicted nucleic-acid-binding Zn-ribbon protein